MPPPSMARSFFEQIRTATDPVAFIRGLVNSTPPTYETDWLDFKQQPSSDLKQPKWREMWVEALAGFANNQGGVILWGIDARKDPATNVDAASGEKPVDNPNGVKSRLIELQRQATDPPLANAEIEAYEIPSAPGTGFVVCFVPEGPFKPYRTEEGRKSQYVIRAGDNFVAMSRSVLQSLFYPQVQARFRIRSHLLWIRRQTHEDGGTVVAEFACHFEITNDGTGSAANPFVQLRLELGREARKVKFRPAEDWSDDRLPFASVERKRPLHPGAGSRFLVVEWEAPTKAAGEIFVPDCTPPAFMIDVFSENQTRQVFRVEFQQQSLLDNTTTTVEAMPVE
jgi:hypothetical protein